MDDDFNTPEAVAVLFDLSNAVNRTQSKETATQLKALAATLGLLERNPIEFLQGKITEARINATEAPDVVSISGAVSHTPTSIDLLIKERIAAKHARNYAEADRIRKELFDAGIVLEDSATGTTWRRV